MDVTRIQFKLRRKVRSDLWFPNSSLKPMHIFTCDIALLSCSGHRTSHKFNLRVLAAVNIHQMSAAILLRWLEELAS